MGFICKLLSRVSKAWFLLWQLCDTSESSIVKTIFDLNFIFRHLTSVFNVASTRHWRAINDWWVFVVRNVIFGRCRYGKQSNFLPNSHNSWKTSNLNAIRWIIKLDLVLVVVFCNLVYLFFTLSLIHEKMLHTDTSIDCNFFVWKDFLLRSKNIYSSSPVDAIYG